jgi:hypothetical protein
VPAWQVGHPEFKSRYSQKKEEEEILKSNGLSMTACWETAGKSDLGYSGRIMTFRVQDGCCHVKLGLHRAYMGAIQQSFL